jgi:hypothetical protein
MGFDLCNHTLEIRESIWDSNSYNGNSLGNVRFHSLTLFALLGACDVTLGSFSWPATLQPLASIESPRLGLQHQKCSNYALTNLLFGLCGSAWLTNCLSFSLVPSRNSNTPLYPQSFESQQTCLDFLFFHCFHFRLTFYFIKELGNTSSVFKSNLTRCPIWHSSPWPLVKNTCLLVKKTHLINLVSLKK